MQLLRRYDALPTCRDNFIGTLFADRSITHHGLNGVEGQDPYFQVLGNGPPVVLGSK